MNKLSKILVIMTLKTQQSSQGNQSNVQPDLHQYVSCKWLPWRLHHRDGLFACKVTIKYCPTDPARVRREKHMLEQVGKKVCSGMSRFLSIIITNTAGRPHSLPFVPCLAFIREPPAAFPRCTACTEGIHPASAQAFKIKDLKYCQSCVLG